MASGGGELIYRNGQALLAAEVDTAGTFSSRPPEIFFDGEGRLPIEANPRAHAMGPDGPLAALIAPAGATESSITVVQNWHQELLERVPVP